MDGRKSLMSSWNQKRGPFQEEAQRHIFGARKEGHKFEHQPKRRLPPKPSTPPPSRAAADTSKLQSSLPESPSVEDKFWDRRCHVSPDITDQEINSKDVSSSTTENAMEQKGLKNMLSLLSFFKDIAFLSSNLHLLDAAHIHRDPVKRNRCRRNNKK